jgi:serine/threonine protein kinase
MSGNEKIDYFIQKIQFKINSPDAIFEWIPYNQFDEIKKIGKGGFSTVYSAIWKNGPLLYLKSQDGKYKRDTNKKVALKCLENSQNFINKFLDEV